MDNYFVSSCKRVKDWICRQFGQKEKKTVHHKKFADGGEVIVWETGRAGEEAASYENLFLRKEIAGFRTNIPVSYTHLDVYKRQTEYNCLNQVTGCVY